MTNKNKIKIEIIDEGGEFPPTKSMQNIFESLDELSEIREKFKKKCNIEVYSSREILYIGNNKNMFLHYCQQNGLKSAQKKYTHYRYAEQALRGLNPEHIAVKLFFDNTVNQERLSEIYKFLEYRNIEIIK